MPMLATRNGVVCWDPRPSTWQDMKEQKLIPTTKGLDQNRSLCVECYFQNSKPNDVKLKTGKKLQNGTIVFYPKPTICRFGCITCKMPFCLRCIYKWHKRRQEVATQANVAASPSSMQNRRKPKRKPTNYTAVPRQVPTRTPKRSRGRPRGRKRDAPDMATTSPGEALRSPPQTRYSLRPTRPATDHLAEFDFALEDVIPPL